MLDRLQIPVIPPHNLEAERALLGAILFDGAPALERVAGRLQAEDFYKEGHRMLYRRLLALQETERGIDALTVADALREAGELEDIGGPASLALIEAEACTLFHLENYVQIVLRESGKREAIRAMAEGIGQAASNGLGPAAIATQTAQVLAEIAERTDPEAFARSAARVVRPQPVGAVLADVLAALDAPADPTRFVPSPIPELNERLGGGLLPGEAVTIGGRPGMAKTALALQWAVHAATYGHATLVISREMRSVALGRRILAQQAQVSATALRRHDVDPSERTRIDRALPRLRGLPLWFDDQSETIGQIRRVVTRGRYRLVIVDYLQLVRSPEDAKTRRLEVSAVSAGLKRVAMRVGCSTVGLSSLRRPLQERGKPQPPTLEALKESGDIEADSDVVLLLHQPSPKSTDRVLLFAKLREGESGDQVTLAFTPTYVRFTEVPRGREPGDDDVPF